MDEGLMHVDVETTLPPEKYSCLKCGADVSSSYSRAYFGSAPQTRVASSELTINLVCIQPFGHAYVTLCYPCLKHFILFEGEMRT